MITVREVIELGLPIGARLVAGESGLEAEVMWVTRPAPNPPAFGHLRGGELLFLTPRALQNLDERLTLDASIRQLAGFSIAGVAFAGRIAPNARVAADAADLPLIQLPQDADLAQLEREIAHLIDERRRDVQRRTHEASRRLMELAISGESLTSLAAAVVELAGCDVIIEARDGRILATGWVDAESEKSTVASIREGRPEALAWLGSTATGSPAEPPSTQLRMPEGRTRFVAPIMGRDGPLGMCSLVAKEVVERAELNALASRSAAACAVVLSREHAAAQARQDLELNVLDEILDGALRSEISLDQQARRLGYDLTGDFVVLVARINASTGVGANRLHEGKVAVFEESLRSRGSGVMWRLRNNQAEIVCAAPDFSRVTALIMSIFEDIGQRLPHQGGGALSMGAGRVHAGIAGIRLSHQEARHALQMGRRLNGAGSITRFENLGVYRLIFAAQELPELRIFHDEALGALIDYDLNHGADLVGTLQAFFAARCGPKEAAALLGVHRNTVLYRLERIQELTGFDLNDAEVRLRLHLAVNAHIALFGDRVVTARRQVSWAENSTSSG